MIENKKLKKEIEQLKGQTQEKDNVVPEVENEQRKEDNLQVKSEVKSETSSNVKVLTTQEKLKFKMEREKKQRESRNIAILITGAILIILSAIIFLFSTWTIMPNVVKTIIIAVVGGVFLGASKIAKDKFELPKASNTFFYIAMAYIPIFFIAIWAFRLVGDYLGILGEGSNIYFTLVGAIISTIYYIIYRIKNNNGMLYSSIIAKIFTVIMLVISITVEIYAIQIGLLLYNFILMIVVRRTKKKKLGFISGINYILAILVSISTLPMIIWNIGENGLAYIAISILSIFNFIMLYLDDKKEKVNCYFANIFICMLCYSIINTIFIGMEDIVKIIIFVAYVVISNIVQRFINNKDFTLASNIISGIALGITYLYSIIAVDMLVAGIIAIIEAVMFGSMFILNGDKKQHYALSFLFIASIIIGILSIYLHYQLEYPVYILSFIALCVISDVLQGFRKDLHICSLVTTHIVTYIIYFITFIFRLGLKTNVIYLALLCAVQIATYIRNKKLYAFKYLSYISAMGTLVSLCSVCNIDLVKRYCPLIITVIIGAIETKFKSKKDKVFLDFFSGFMQIMSFIFLFGVDIVGIIIAIAFALLIYVYNKYNKKNDALNLIPLISLSILMLFVDVDRNIACIFRLIIASILTGYTIYKKKMCFETWFAFVFLISSFNVIEGCLRYTLLTIWALINMIFTHKKRDKQLFKAISYISGFLLYNEIINATGISTNYRAFFFIGIIVVYNLLLKTIKTKYSEQLEILDYFFYAIICLVSLSQFLDAIDALIFIIFLVASIVFSYIVGWGSVFIMSIVSLGVNVIYQTREFWLLIPWYIYLLITGGILITFAVINELNEKKDKVSIGKKFIELKQKIDKKSR